MSFEIYVRPDGDKDPKPETPELRAKAETVAETWTDILLDVEEVAETVQDEDGNTRYVFSRADLQSGIRDAVLDALALPD